jgi:hypothetical protein
VFSSVVHVDRHVAIMSMTIYEIGYQFVQLHSGKTYFSYSAESPQWISVPDASIGHNICISASCSSLAHVDCKAAKLTLLR